MRIVAMLPRPGICHDCEVAASDQQATGAFNFADVEPTLTLQMLIA